MERLAREWLLTGSILGVLSTSLFLQRWPHLDTSDLEVVWLIGVLLVAVNGLQQSGLMHRLTWWLETGSHAPVKLVLGVYFLSMLVTNDVALVIAVPITLMMETQHKERLVILEALAANAGSALSPIGNPQNLYIYWHYQPDPLTFAREIAPFSLFFLALLVILTAGLPSPPASPGQHPKPPLHASTWRNAGLLPLAIACVLGWIPFLWSLVVPLYAAMFDRESLKIDFLLLTTLITFFLLTDNITIMLGGAIRHPEHIFLLTALGSQLISNVPATLLVSGYTNNWQALLWGASVGGFGSLMGSLANLIAYRLYIAQNRQSAFRFAAMFLITGGIAFCLGTLLFFCRG